MFGIINPEKLLPVALCCHILAVLSNYLNLLIISLAQESLRPSKSLSCVVLVPQDECLTVPQFAGVSVLHLTFCCPSCSAGDLWNLQVLSDWLVILMASCEGRRFPIQLYS